MTIEQDALFEKQDYTVAFLPEGEYDNCVFKGCDFSNGELRNCVFIDCEFTDCNLSMVKLGGTSFRDVRFADCKMLGLQFDSCNQFGLSFGFVNCQLSFASFYTTKLKKTRFSQCVMHETDFSEADLSLAVLEECVLTGAVFNYTNLEGCGLRTAVGYSFDPEENRVKGARLSAEGALRLLDKYKLRIENQ
ncbi:MAG: pentapeptide repeat-containing protein [Tannerellaceae bacterium]